MKILYLLEFLPPYVKREVESVSEAGNQVTVTLPAGNLPGGTSALWSKITSDPRAETLRLLRLDLLTSNPLSLAIPVLMNLRHIRFFLSSLKEGELRFAIAAVEVHRKLPKGYRPDVIHAHFALDAAQIASKLASVYKLPYTVTTHATDIFVPRHRNRLKKVLRNAASVLTISDYNRKYLAEKNLFNGTVTVSKLGIDVNALPSEVHPSESTAAVCIASGLVPKKGVDVLLKAAELVKDRFPELKFTVVGSDPDGILLEKYRKEASNLPVNFVGALSSEETLSLTASATFFVLPCVEAPNGDRDGIPVALMEAMGMGIPCISTGVSGIPELINHGDSGLLAEAGSPDSLAAMIGILLDDSDRRADMGRKGKEKVISEHSPAKQALTLTRVFQRVCNFPGKENSDDTQNRKNTGKLN